MINRILSKISNINRSTKIILGALIVLISIFLYSNENSSPNTQILDTPYIQTRVGTISLKNSINIASSAFIKSNNSSSSTKDITLSWNKVSYSRLPSDIKYSLQNIYDDKTDTVYIATVNNPLEEDIISVEHILIIRKDSVLIAAFTCVNDSLGKGHTIIVSLREAVLLAQQKITQTSL